MSLPPPLPRSIRPQSERFILVAFVAFAFVGALLWAGHELGLPRPVCVWKGLTGLPCAGCGGTRAVSMLSAGDIGGAVALNPGAVVAVFFSAALAAYAAVVLVFRLEPLRPSFLRGKTWRVLALLALGANWLYLLLAGRV